MIVVGMITELLGKLSQLTWFTSSNWYMRLILNKFLIKPILGAINYLSRSNEMIPGWWDNWFMATSTNDRIAWQTSFYYWCKLGLSSPTWQEPHPLHRGGGISIFYVGKAQSGARRT